MPNAAHRIAYLTAGAAGMFCGSCMHDNALAKQLVRLGFDCFLIPVYTPIRTDEENVSVDRVFMGGINVYLQQSFPWLAYTPRWLDALLNQPWLIRYLTRNAGKTSPRLLGALTLSMLQGSHGRLRKEFHRMLDWLESDLHPDTYLFSNLLIGGCIPDLRRRSNSRVYVTLQGDDIFLDYLLPQDRDPVLQAMRQLVQHVDGFLIHSQDYADRMKELLGLPSEKIHIVPLGIGLEEQTIVETAARHSGQESQLTSSLLSQSLAPPEFTIGYLARMAPEKGLHRLVDAFIELSRDSAMDHVRLRMAGWMGPQHTDYWNEQVFKLNNAGLEGRWEYVGSIDKQQKLQFLSGLDLFCVPTVYAEPKGLFLLEAVAVGVPYLQPDHGAFPEIHARLGRYAGELRVGDLFSNREPSQLAKALKEKIQSQTRRYETPRALMEEIDIRQHAQRVANLLTGQH